MKIGEIKGMEVKLENGVMKIESGNDSGWIEEGSNQWLKAMEDDEFAAAWESLKAKS